MTIRSAIILALSRVLSWLSPVQAGAALLVVALEAGLGTSASWYTGMLHVCGAIVLIVFTLRHVHVGCKDPARLKTVATVAALASALFFSLVFSARIGAGIALFYDGARLYQRYKIHRFGEFQGRVLHGVGEAPARALVVSFLGLIAVGTVLLWLPASTRSREHVDLIDALFVAVSATCVTGLSPVDTALTWSPFGKGVIFMLFQLGALGIMVVAGAMTLALGRALGSRQGEQLSGVFDEEDASELRKLIATVVASTLAVELVGALLLFSRFAMDMPVHKAATYALFHAVSAFCNAGFSLWSNSLTGYAADPMVNVVMGSLILLGGLGFGVMLAVFRVVRRRALHRHVFSSSASTVLGTRVVRVPAASRLTLHARLVLWTSALLVFFPALVIFFFEFDRSLASLPLPAKVLAAAFQSITTRTAGFNSVPLDVLHPVTVVLFVVLMLIGASPGSTGGGIKTTTIAVVFLAIRAFLTERDKVEVFGRSISQAQVMRALAMLGGAGLTFILGLMLLLSVEDQPFQWLLFETASALGTTGLSMGATSALSVTGRVVVATLMFVGRVGPLTAMAALARRSNHSAPLGYPLGKVLVG